MDIIRDFVKIPDLNVKDIKEIHGIARFIKNKRARRILGQGKLQGTLSKISLKKLTFAELLDVCDLIQKTDLEELLEDGLSFENCKIVTSEQQTCFICGSNLEYFSSSTATLYDDKSGKYYVIIKKKSKQK